MSKQKSLYTVRDAVAMAFENMPEQFISIHLSQMAKSIMARPMCMDGTILRRLRELRTDNPKKYNYIVIDSEQGLYQKKTQ
jgi:hypothetical protein